MSVSGPWERAQHQLKQVQAKLFKTLRGWQEPTPSIVRHSQDMPRRVELILYAPLTTWGAPSSFPEHLERHWEWLALWAEHLLAVFEAPTEEGLRRVLQEHHTLGASLPDLFGDWVAWLEALEEELAADEGLRPTALYFLERAYSPEMALALEAWLALEKERWGLGS